MRTRLTLTGLLVILLAAPVIAGGGFRDVPQDGGPLAEAVYYTRDQGFFKGFPDGDFRPGQVMTETQYIKVAERLYNRYDVWTRADWAQLLYAGLPSLAAPTATTTTTTTTTLAATTTTRRPVVIEPSPPPVPVTPPPVITQPPPPPPRVIEPGGPVTPPTATSTTTTTTLPNVADFQATAAWYIGFFL